MAAGESHQSEQGLELQMDPGNETLRGGRGGGGGGGAEGGDVTLHFGIRIRFFSVYPVEKNRVPVLIPHWGNLQNSSINVVQREEKFY